MDKNTWKYLSKSEKNQIDTLSVEQIVALAGEADEGDTHSQMIFVRIHDVLADLLCEGHRLNDEQKAILMLPYQIWGSQYSRTLYQYRKLMWDRKKARKKKQ